MAKKLRAKVNGVKVKDGEIVTLVVQARVTVTETTRYNGTKDKMVEFQSQDAWGSVYVEADDNDGKFSVTGATIVKVKP